jgi:hypothetical protein
MWGQANGKDTLKRPKHRLQAMKNAHIRDIEAKKSLQTTEIGHSFEIAGKPLLSQIFLQHRASDSRNHPPLSGNPLSLYRISPCG